MPTPSCSAWMTELMKLESSSTPMRSSSSIIASRRSLPIATSRSIRERSSASGPLLFSATRASAASRPRPASTHVVMRSIASGLSFALAPHARKNPANAGEHDNKYGLLQEQIAREGDEHQEAEACEQGEDDRPESDVALERHRIAGHHQLLLNVSQDGRRQNRADSARDALNPGPQHTFRKGQLQVYLVVLQRYSAGAEVLDAGLHAGGAGASEHGVGDAHDRPEDGYGYKCDKHLRLLISRLP